MLSTPKIARIEMEGDSIRISAEELSASFDRRSITALYINSEQDEIAREMEVSLNKIKRMEPELADLLRFQLTVHGISFSFIVDRRQGDPVASFFENDLRSKLSLGDEGTIHYPVFFRASAPSFEDDKIGDGKPEPNDRETIFTAGKSPGILNFH